MSLSIELSSRRLSHVFFIFSIKECLSLTNIAPLFIIYIYHSQINLGYVFFYIIHNYWSHIFFNISQSQVLVPNVFFTFISYKCRFRVSFYHSCILVFFFFFNLKSWFLYSFIFIYHKSFSYSFKKKIFFVCFLYLSITNHCVIFLYLSDTNLSRVFLFIFLVTNLSHVFFYIFISHKSCFRIFFLYLTFTLHILSLCFFYLFVAKSWYNIFFIFINNKS